MAAGSYQVPQRRWRELPSALRNAGSLVSRHGVVTAGHDGCFALTEICVLPPVMTDDKTQFGAEMVSSCKQLNTCP